MKLSLNKGLQYKSEIPEWCSIKGFEPLTFGVVHALKTETHIWRVYLDPSADTVDKFASVLSSDERKKADGFYFSKHRRRFIVCRGVLRHILNHYLQIGPEKIVFHYTERGKPVLAADKNSFGLSFNLSHSSELALVAITRERSVGIDLEILCSGLKSKQLARRYFFRDEYLKIDDFEDDRHRYFFYGFWTLKEAYLKATGEGLANLQNVQIKGFPWGNPTLSVNRNAPSGFPGWYLFSFMPSEGYMAALALEGKNSAVSFFSWKHPERDHLSAFL
jgi:4'-phosphopantetheinyl transferase